MSADDPLRVDPALQRAGDPQVPDPAATAPIPGRRDEQLSLPPMVASELFDGSEVDPSELVHDDGVPRRWDKAQGKWVAPEGLEQANTYAVTPVSEAPAPRAARRRRRRRIPPALQAAAFGVLVGSLMLIILALVLYLLS